MKIFELFEQTVAPTPPGQGAQLGTTKPTEPAPQTSNTPQTPNPTGTPPTTQAGQNPTQQQPMGQDPAQQQQMQQIAQQSKDNLTDLDKIAAQIVGLKQKQQQMQQQLQQTTTP